MLSRNRSWPLTMALLLAPLCDCASQPPSPAPPPPPKKKNVPVVELKPPPADRVVKLRGKRLVLKSGRVISDVTREPWRPRVPPPWNREDAIHKGTYKVCVAADGSVRSVDTLKTAGKGLLDEAFSSAIQKWRYQPARLGPKKVPFCYPLALKVRYVRS